MSDYEHIFEEAESRINSIRKGDLTVKVVKDNKPVNDVTVEIRQKRHQFLFGANCFSAGGFPNEEDNARYTELFTGIFNFATLPFYWSSYEKERGRKSVDNVKRLAAWCRENNLTAKGHPLVWHQTLPGWIREDEDIRELTRDRIIDIIGEFKDDIKWWDAVNEITVAQRAGNQISRWAAHDGCLNVLREVVSTVLSCDPEANLLINEFNFSDEGAYDRLLEELKENNVPIKAVGMQSHMHEGMWPLETVWKLCNRFSQFGWPLHFTELSVLSGKAKGKIDFLSQTGNEWIVGVEYEAEQEKYVRDLYTLLFSHPAVEAITWWDIADGCWLQAPSGLIRKDLTPKRAYNALYELIRQKWWTDTSGSTDSEGCFTVNAFYGEYEISVQRNGYKKRVEYNLRKGCDAEAENELIIKI